MSTPETKSGVIALIAILASVPTEADIATVRTRLQQMHDGGEFEHEPAGHLPIIQVVVDGKTLQVQYDENGQVAGFGSPDTQSTGALEQAPAGYYDFAANDARVRDVLQKVYEQVDLEDLDDDTFNEVETILEVKSGGKEVESFDPEDIAGATPYSAGNQGEGRDTVQPDPNAPGYNAEVAGIVINQGNQSPPTQPQAIPDTAGRTGAEPQHHDETNRAAADVKADASSSDAAKDAKDEIAGGVSQDNIDQQKAAHESLPPDAKVAGQAAAEAALNAKGDKHGKKIKGAAAETDDKGDLEI